MTARKPAQDCASLAEIRAGIDSLDAELIALLAERIGYVRHVAPFKIKEGVPAAAPDRVAHVLAAVRARGEAAGLDPDMLEAMWRPMIDWAIAHEEEVMGKG
ncbi:chorismate mutase [Rhodovulum sp. DZ06]|uniref:chorismate mutase n=1 Tax=Rhodovulum sp. DZ06 TaxID=3425126 RepID=UPI003D35992E